MFMYQPEQLYRTRAGRNLRTNIDRGKGMVDLRAHECAHSNNKEKQS